MVRARKRKISDGPDVIETEQHCVYVRCVLRLFLASYLCQDVNYVSYLYCQQLVNKR